jgi:hypothetical protein
MGSDPDLLSQGLGSGAEDQADEEIDVLGDFQHDDFLDALVDPESLADTIVARARTIRRSLMEVVGYKQITRVNYFEKANDFYAANISSVEIENKGQLMMIFFHTPSMCKYLTSKGRSDIIYKAKRTTH